MRSLRRLLFLLTALCMMTACLSAKAEISAPEDGAEAVQNGAQAAETEIAEGEEPAEAASDPETGEASDGVTPWTEADQEQVPDWADDLAEAEAPALRTEGLEVYFLDLGRVDGILILCDGESSFIDVGFAKNAPTAIRYMKYLGVDHLDSYIASHAHADHVGGAARIIGEFRPKVLYLNRTACRSAILDSASKADAKVVKETKSVIVKAGDVFSIGGAQVKCLGPRRIKNCATGSYSENFNSLILRLDYKGHSFLFTGDTHDDYLRQANRQFPGELDVDVFKNPHHNGKHEADVIKMISPKVTVFCTSNESQPGREYLQLLKSQGSRICITGSHNQGNIAFVCDDEGAEMRVGYPMTSIALDPVPELYEGQVYTLKGSIEPKAQGKTRWISWRSSDSGVVAAANGKIKAVAPGTATVSATTLNGLTAEVEVEVRDALVQLEYTEVRIAVGEEKKLRAKILPAGKKGITGEWVSADSSILVVMPDGEIIGAKEGTTQAIARLSNGAEAACTVTVAGFPVDSITLDRKKAKMKVGDTLALKATVKPDYFSGMQLEWVSSNEKVLWVDSEGVVTAVGKGTAKIGVRASENKYAVCTIKVE